MSAKKKTKNGQIEEKAKEIKTKMTQPTLRDE